MSLPLQVNKWFYLGGGRGKYYGKFPQGDCGRDEAVSRQGGSQVACVITCYRDQGVKHSGQGGSIA